MRLFILPVVAILSVSLFPGCRNNEYTRLREEFAKLETESDRLLERDTAFAEEIKTLKTVSKRLAERVKELEVTQHALVKEFGKLREIVESAIYPNGLQIKKIDGTVMETYPEHNLVMLSVGTDDGVELFYKFFIYRKDRYIGAMVVNKIWEDSSAGQMITEEHNANKLMVEKGDSATTYLAD